MNKKLIGAFILILLLLIAWPLYSPFFIDNEVHEELPFQIEESDVDVSSVVEDNSIEEPFTETPENRSENVTNESIQENNSDTLPEPTISHQGSFERIDYDVEGSFTIYEIDGKHILRIEDLDITNGPDLHLVLANEWSNAVSDYEIIYGEELNGEKFANKGSYNVEIPEEINPDDYEYLLIHCVRYRHTFAGASIKAN